jgi:hypothetical protein
MVARWPHGCRRQCSEVARSRVRIPPKGEDFFEGRKLRRAVDVCVCLVGADGRVVEGRATLSRHHREVSRVQIPGRMGLPWMFCAVFHVVLSRKKKREDRVGVGGRGKYPGAPPHIKGKRGKSRPQGTVVDQNKIGQSKFRLCDSIFLRNPSLRKQKCQK